jgi:hypothetical protein
MPQMVKFESFRDYMFRTVSQITLNYRGKGLDNGHVGPVHGGDRLPWVKLGESDNYQAFKRIGWQIHVYGTANDNLARWCDEQRLPLAVFPWNEEMNHAGLRENALYLIRPDTYVALAERNQSAEAVEQFFAKVEVKP